MPDLCSLRILGTDELGLAALRMLQAKQTLCRDRSARKACQPICALNPYNNDWTIRAKVTSKMPLRRFEKNGQTHSVGTLEVVDDQVEFSGAFICYLASWRPSKSFPATLVNMTGALSTVLPL
jgi:hypothetical protein